MNAMRTGRRLHRDRLGQMTLEWALILAAVALPLYAAFRLCLEVLAGKYEFLTFMNAMPFP